MMFEPEFLKSDQFNVWQEKSRHKRDDLLSAPRSQHRFDERIWQDFKNDVLIPFLGRCSYCEGRYAAGEFCEAEHYRPKNAVTEDRKPVSHPGYYWLAYEWHNLLLACKKCNSTHPDRDQTKRASHPGKLCEFPVGAVRISSPSSNPDNWFKELQAEEPMLLHPYCDDPSEHIEARCDGWIWYKTERGRVTIEVCHLNRKELRIERRLAEEQVRYRAAHIWGNLARELEKERFSRNDPFSTYLNCKLAEELRNRNAETSRRLEAIFGVTGVRNHGAL